MASNKRMQMAMNDYKCKINRIREKLVGMFAKATDNQAPNKSEQHTNPQQDENAEQPCTLDRQPWL